MTDWDDMERIWEWVYGEGLKTLSEEVSLILQSGVGMGDGHAGNVGLRDGWRYQDRETARRN